MLWQIIWQACAPNNENTFIFHFIQAFLTVCVCVLVTNNVEKKKKYTCTIQNSSNTTTFIDNSFETCLGIVWNI